MNPSDLVSQSGDIVFIENRPKSTQEFEFMSRISLLLTLACNNGVYPTHELCLCGVIIPLIPVS